MSVPQTFRLIEGPSDYHPSAHNHEPATFGAEFEFSLAASFRKWERGQIPWSGFFAVKEDAQIDVCDLINEEFGERISLTAAGEDGNARETEDTLGFWFVEEDGSVNAPQDGRFYAPMEIQTPALVFEDNSIREVQRALAMLTETYRERIVTGPTSSVHVHVGFGTKGYELHELKGVLAIWWVFEAQFFSLVPRYRHESTYCRMVSHSTMLGQLVEDNTDIKVEDRVLKGLDMILAATSQQELFQFWGIVKKNTQKVGLKIDRLQHSGSEQTIEFRIHEGCLDPEETEKLVPWLEARAVGEGHGQMYPIGEVLRAMKLDDCGEYFDRKIERMALEPETESGDETNNKEGGEEDTPEGSDDESFGGDHPSIGSIINQLDWNKLDGKRKHC